MDQETFAKDFLSQLSGRSIKFQDNFARPMSDLKQADLLPTLPEPPNPKLRQVPSSENNVTVGKENDDDAESVKDYLLMTKFLVSITFKSLRPPPIDIKIDDISQSDTILAVKGNLAKKLQKPESQWLQTSLQVKASEGFSSRWRFDRKDNRRHCLPRHAFDILLFFILNSCSVDGSRNPR